MKAALALVCAVALAGCNTHGKGTYGSVFAPDNTFSGVVATISPSAFFPAVAGSPCFAIPGSAFDLAIRTSSAITVNQVTLRLGDGSTVGGQSVTFPNASLVSQFRSTQIAGGSSRLMTFPSPFGCTFLPTQLIFADIVMIDSFGNSRIVTASASLR